MMYLMHSWHPRNRFATRSAQDATNFLTDRMKLRNRCRGVNTLHSGINVRKKLLSQCALSFVRSLKVYKQTVKALIESYCMFTTLSVRLCVVQMLQRSARGKAGRVSSKDYMGE